MGNIELMKEDNKNKHLISVGDICISNKYGVGHVEEIEQDDCWYPISVCFKQVVYEFGQPKKKTKYCVYNTKGQTNSISQELDTDEEIVDANFYKQINFS
jgi:disulfide oxidoreductase YuzD